MWSRSTKQRRAAMRRRQKPLTFAATLFAEIRDRATQDALRPLPALPLYVTHTDPDGRIHATTTPPKEQDWQLVTDAEPFRYLDTPLPARTWRGTIAVPPKEPK